jgi:hypothetical protein
MNRQSLSLNPRRVTVKHDEAKKALAPLLKIYEAVGSLDGILDAAASADSAEKATKRRIVSLQKQFDELRPKYDDMKARHDATAESVESQLADARMVADAEGALADVRLKVAGDALKDAEAKHREKMRVFADETAAAEKKLSDLESSITTSGNPSANGCQA